MKDFIRNCLCLGIVIFVVSAIIEVALLYKTNTYSYKHDYVMHHLDDIHVILMGNSHIYQGLIPDSIGEGVFNDAISARKINYDVELLGRYVPLMPNLKAVVMPLDYLSFYFGREHPNPRRSIRDDNGNTNRCMYFKYMGIHDKIWYWPELINSKLDYMSRFLKSEEELRECDSLGYNELSISKRQKTWEIYSLPFIIDTSKPKDRSKYEQLNEYYRKMADITSERGIRFILIGTPLYKSYQDDMNKVVIREMKNFVASLQNDYKNVEYYDYSFDSRFKADDFHDASHLTREGAAKFSIIIRSIL